MEKRPLGIRITLITNWISIFFFVLFGFLVGKLAIADFIKRMGNPEWTMIVICAVMAFLVGALPGIFLLFVNKNLKRGKKRARIWQITISILELIVFPVGTVLGLIALYFMFFDKPTKEALRLS